MVLERIALRRELAEAQRALAAKPKPAKPARMQSKIEVGLRKQIKVLRDRLG